MSLSNLKSKLSVLKDKIAKMEKDRLELDKKFGKVNNNYFCHD